MMLLHGALTASKSRENVSAIKHRLLSDRACSAFLAALFWLLFGGASAFGQIPCRYEVTVLPNIDCGFGSNPPTVTAVNSQGHVVGHYGSCSGAQRAVLWTGGPSWIHLPLPQGVVGARAYDINDNGEIVGVMKVQIGQNTVMDHAMLFRNGQMMDLGYLPGGNTSEALAINNNSQVAGYENNTVTGPLRAFLWDTGVLKALNLPQGRNSMANDIDEGRWSCYRLDG